MKKLKTAYASKLFGCILQKIEKIDGQKQKCKSSNINKPDLN
jgi:hypothetical protein